MAETPDGALILAGHARSTNGDVTGVHGSIDYWVVKLALETSEVQVTASTPLNLFPNPAQHYLSLSLPPDEPVVQIIITDTQGREWLMPTNNAQQRLDISRLPAGAYWLTAVALSGQRYVGRFVKE